MRRSAVIGALAAAFALSTVSAWGGEVLRYDFAGNRPYIVDRSGNGNHGLALDAERVTDGERSCLRLGEKGCVQLPEASLLAGTSPASGAIEISVKPEFDPLALDPGTWDGWVVLAYLQKTSPNGLPDGYNEIGLALHGPRLIAKVAGADTTAPFAVIDTPLREGIWTRLRMEWEPGRRALFVDGKLAAERAGAYEAATLDAFPAYIGRHPSSGKWHFQGLVADVTIETGGAPDQAPR